MVEATEWWILLEILGLECPLMYISHLVSKIGKRTFHHKHVLVVQYVL